MNGLPKDPIMLLSVVNTNLRDSYVDLDAFCDAKNIYKEELISRLSAVGYVYDKNQNQFK